MENGQSKIENIKEPVSNKRGAIGWVLLWAIGIPLPILAALFLMRGCT
jgi:hypothetical protein